VSSLNSCGLGHSVTSLDGLRVLVVEDEGAIATMIEDVLQNLGCQVVASVAHLRKAMEIASTAEIDFAVLDVNLGGEPIFPVAEILRDRRIGFLFSTGYDQGSLPPEFVQCPVINKPFSERQLRETLLSASVR
jgi:DNA-binding response OmpR family regulator